MTQTGSRRLTVVKGVYAGAAHRTDASCVPQNILQRLAAGRVQRRGDDDGRGPTRGSSVPIPSAAPISGWRWRVLHVVWRCLWVACMSAVVLSMLHTVFGVPLQGVLAHVWLLATCMALPVWLAPIARELGINRERITRSLRCWGGRLAIGGVALLWLGQTLALTLFAMGAQLADGLWILWVSGLAFEMMLSGLLLAFLPWNATATREATAAYHAGHPATHAARRQRCEEARCG
jgi:hypothetical protein